MKNIIFMGPQGSGKGTQVKKLHEFLKAKGKDVFLLDTGAALRAFSEEPGVVHEKVKASLAKGELQPAFLVMYILGRELIERAYGKEYAIIDGSPRTRLQAELLDSAFDFMGARDSVDIFWIDVSDEEALGRLLKRGRSDDTKEGIMKRLSWSRENAESIFAFYKDKPSYTLHRINGEQSPEDVHRDILKELTI